MPYLRAETHLGLSSLESHCRAELSRLEDQDLSLTLSSPSAAQSLLRQLLCLTGGISSSMAPGRSSRKYRVRFFHTSCCQTIALATSGEPPLPQVKSLISILEGGWVTPLSSVAPLRLVDGHISLTLHEQVSIFCQGHYPSAPTASGTQQGAASRKCIKTNQQERRDLWANSLLLNYLYFIISSKSLAVYWSSSIIEEFPRSLASFA